MDKLRGVLDFCIHHQTVLSYSFVSLLTAASEHIFSSVVFKCPCDSGNMLYGSIFLIVPAFILFLLGYVVNPKTWHLLTGVCSLDKRAICARYCQTLVLVTASASVAPVTWLAVALLGASFYECAASGNSLIKSIMCKDKGQQCQDLVAKIPCNPKFSEEVSKEALSLQAQSQLIGWLLIVVIMAIALISTCVKRCRSPVSYLQHKFQATYLKKEEEVFERKVQEHATRLAERNVDDFFGGTDPASFTTPSNTDWQNISLLYTFDPQKQYYSMLHAYVNERRGSSNRVMQGDQNLLVSELVDETSARESGF
ncbi:PREDICTED: protein FAM26F [Cariama cristata]|uniref:protein FAM26F n=1 Tax=Cariama cristata TaxID=54380 RepID=UPI0005202B9A|nr:PREDICTED: protein FAM26F [Cariama cristata]